MIKVRQKGDFVNLTKYLERNTKTKLGDRLADALLQHYAKKGVDALSSATPVDTGLTASSWYYTIERSDDKTVISFNNSNVQNGWANIAILLQYGHATRNGGWVEGRDYINPAIQPIFDEIANSLWKEVTRV